MLDWLVNRWPKPSIRVRDILQFGPPAARNRKNAITLAKARLLASVALPVRTVTWCSFSDAWMTRTIDLPWGVVSRSFSAWSRRPLAGPIAATV
jgi:hypothetical protein